MHPAISILGSPLFNSWCYQSFFISLSKYHKREKIWLMSINLHSEDLQVLTMGLGGNLVTYIPYHAKHKNVSCFEKRSSITDLIRIIWVKVFRIIPEFRILRLTFHRKSASKSWIRQIIITSLIYFHWMKVFRINPEFRILRLTFHRKSASKCWIRQIMITSLFNFHFILGQLTI